MLPNDEIFIYSSLRVHSNFFPVYRVVTSCARQFKSLVVTEKMFDIHCVLGRKAAGS